jgi:hypothetical protein
MNLVTVKKQVSLDFLKKAKPSHSQKRFLSLPPFFLQLKKTATIAAL